MTTVLRGLLEALVLGVAAAILAAVAALIWVLAGDGEFTTRLGMSLIAIGALLAITGTLSLSRMGTADMRAWFGAAPELGDAGGGMVLTGVGIFLFVSLPLIAVGVLLNA
ncbi:hypothetical protein [Micromonospora sonneratiae]|uniref:Uncharacterized protein n=1 Tax=Micromonospora sonneratiae TaxID=1184706 RepID=A0ABW3Y8E2_9ACTN